MEVVGIARDTVTDELTERPWAAAYLPRPASGEEISLIAHSDLPPGETLRGLAARLRALDAAVAVFDPMTLREHIANRLDSERALSRLLTLIGILALVLAAIGLYGVSPTRWSAAHVKSACVWRLARNRTRSSGCLSGMPRAWL